MALEQKGVELIIKGYSAFVSAFSKIEKIQLQAAKAAEQHARQVTQAGSSVDKAITRMTQSTAALTKAQVSLAQSQQYTELAFRNLEPFIQKNITSGKKYEDAASRMVIANGALAKSSIDVNQATAARARATQALIVQMAKMAALTGRKIDIKVNTQTIAELVKHIGTLNIRIVEYTQNGKKQIRFFDEITKKFVSQDSVIQRITESTDQFSQATIASASAAGQATGVIASLQGVFLKLQPAIAVATTVLGIFTAAVGVVMRILGTFAGILRGVVMGAINTVVGGLRLIGNIVSSITRPFFDFFKRAAEVATGILFADALRAIGSGLRDMISGMDDVLSLFQKLDIQFQGLISRDIRRNNPAVQISDAMAEAEVRAKSLLDWVKRVAVTTPFTARSLTQTLAMATAIGLNIDMAKELTLAIGDFTAAMGLSDEHLFRIIYNLGQMYQQGKLNGREFRDLANSFVPVYDIMDRMAANAGITTEEMKKMAFEGKVAVDEFLRAFIQIAEEDFPDAAKKMARTFEGVVSNIRDFFEVILGQELFGPVFSKITGMAADFLDRILTQTTIDTAKLFGYVLSQGFDFLRPALDALGNAVSTALKSVFGDLGKYGKLWFMPVIKAIVTGIVIVKRAIEVIAEGLSSGAATLGQRLQEIATKAYNWGKNIVAMIAKGMAAAIVLITIVIRAITKLLEYWLSPGSPPRVAPNLDKWGAAAMTEYLRGFLKGDWDIFNDIADLMENYLRSLGDKIKETRLVPLILKMRNEVIKAIEGIRSGSLTSAEAFAKLLKRIGKLPKEFKDYAIALFRVEEAQKRVADITKIISDEQKRQKAIQLALRLEQEKLNAIQEKYTKIIEDLQKQLTEVTDEYDEQKRLREIDAAIATGLLTAQERERLEMERRAILIKQQIRDAEEQREEESQGIKDRISFLEKEEEMIQQRIDLLEMEREAAEEALRAEEDKLDAARSLIEYQIKQNELIQEQIDLLDRLREAAKGAAEGIAEQLDLGFQFSIDPEKLKEDIEAVFGPDFLTWIDGLFKTINDEWKDKNPFEELIKPLTGEGGILAPLTELTKEGGPLDTMFKEIDAMLKVIKENEGGTNKFVEAWNSFTAQLNTVDWEKVGESVANMLVEFGKFGGEIDWEKLGKDIGVIVANLVEFTGELSTLASTVDLTKLAEDLAGIVTGIAEITTKLTTSGEENEAAGGTFMGGIFKGMRSEILAWENEHLWWLRVINPMYNAADLLYRLLVKESIFPDMMADIKKVVSDEGDAINKDWDETWQAVSDFIEDPVGKTLDWLENEVLIPLGNYIGGGFTTTVNTFRTGELTWLKEDFTKLGDYINDKFKKALQDLKAITIEPLTEAFSKLGEKLEPIVGWFQALVSAVATLNVSKILKLLQDFFKGTIGGGGKARGGPVKAGNQYVVGEKGREIFVPLMDGMVLPNWMTEQILSPEMSSGGNTYVYNYNVEVNPTYRNLQSEAGVYYDALAALSSVRR